MKRLKILSVLVLVCFLTESIQEIVVSGGEGFRLGWNIVGLEQKLDKKADSHLMLDLKTRISESTIPNDVNLINGEEVLVMPNRATIAVFSDEGVIVTKQHQSLRLINSILNFLILAGYVYFLVLFLKVVVSFSRSKVFEDNNIRRLNIIGIGFVVLGLLYTIWQIIRTYIADSAIEMSNYEISYANVIDWNNIVIGIIILIMTELLRIAVGLKREQELTI